MAAPRQTPRAAAKVDSRLRLVILICFVAIMSYLAARLSTTVVVRPQVDWPLWPGNILLVCVLLFAPRKIWPVLMAAALITFAVYDLHIGLSIRSIISFQLSDAAEILTAALGLSYSFDGVPKLNSVKALAKYSFFAVLLAPVAGAFFGAFTTHGEYWTSWRIAFLSQALGYVTLMPAILGWVGKRSAWLHASRYRYLEALALVTGLAVFGYLSFFSPSTFILAVLTIVPFLLWAALRFGTTGVSSATIGVAFLVVWGAVHGRGPFIVPESANGVPSIQVFLLFVAAPFMVLAVLVEQHNELLEALRSSEERFRLAAQAGKMFAYEWDAATDVIQRSSEFVQVLGFDEATQTTGRQILAKVHAADRERVMAAFAELSPEKPYLRMSFRMARPDGTTIWVERSSRAQFNEQGTLLRIVGMIADITERKRAEEQLQESEERFRLVATTAPVMIWMSGSDKLCTYFNQPWLTFSGRSIHQELGDGWAEGVHAEDLKRCLETYKQAFDRREPFEMEYRLRRHDGEYRWIVDYGVPRFNADGSFAGYIGTASDMTDQKLAREALEKVSGQLIDAQERERRRLARELHDDICQRLAMLSHKIEKVSKGWGRGPLSVADELEQIWQQCSNLTGDVQALSHELHPSILDNLGLATAVKSFCREVSEQSGVTVEFDGRNIPDSLPREVSLALFRVVQEALHNAVRYSGQKHFEVRLQEISRELELEVSDQGVGFDATNTKNRGGLGLVSMAERIYQVNGTFTIDSQPNAGTSIRARVPLAAQSRAMTSTAN